MNDLELTHLALAVRASEQRLAATIVSCTLGLGILLLYLFGKLDGLLWPAIWVLAGLAGLAIVAAAGFFGFRLLQVLGGTVLGRCRIGLFSGASVGVVLSAQYADHSLDSVGTKAFTFAFIVVFLALIGATVELGVRRRWYARLWDALRGARFGHWTGGGLVFALTVWTMGPIAALILGGVFAFIGAGIEVIIRDNFPRR